MNDFEHNCIRCEQLGQPQREDAFWVMKNEKLYLCRSCSLDMVSVNPTYILEILSTVIVCLVSYIKKDNWKKMRHHNEM